MSCASPVTASPARRSRRSRKISASEVSCLTNWMRRADIEDGNRPGAPREDVAELREARKRIRLLEQGNEVLRRATAYLSQANQPGKGRFYASVSSHTCPKLAVEWPAYVALETPTDFSIR